MARALMEAVIALEEDVAVRCVLLTGSGRLFCAGGDPTSFAQVGDALSALLREVTIYLHAALVRLARMDNPLVTAINGPAAGAGIGLALIGDIALADPSAHFTLAYRHRPVAGWRHDMAAAPPDRFATRAGVVPAQHARRGGRSGGDRPGDARRHCGCADRGSQYDRRNSRGATPALGTVRRLLLESGTTSLESHLDAESRGIAAMGRTAQGREGIAAWPSC